jgi:hypothetical protein
MPSPAKLAVVLIAVLSAGQFGYAQPWQEGFEGPQPSWRDDGGDAPYRIVRHQRTQSEAHSGASCEWVQLETENGARVGLSMDVGQPSIIKELAPSVWVKSDRSSVQFAVRVVLPRSIDPRTGQPVVTVLTGDNYTVNGRWQQLQLRGISQLLLQQVHVLRRQIGPQVDDTEAYVDAVLLNVYGMPGATNVWIDDLEIAGYVTMQRIPPTEAARQPVAMLPISSRQSLPMVSLPLVQPVIAAPRHVVRLEEAVLQIDGRPMLPRAIQYRGEPLELLKKIGFNAVWMQRMPTPELLDEAARLGLWLVCPPPRPTSPAGLEAPSAAPADGESGAPAIPPIGPEFDCVLAWNLGEDLTDADLDVTQRWAIEVRTADRRGNRPLICRPRTNLYGFSRPTNLLLLDRRPLGTSLELTDWAAWVRRQPLLAKLGTPIWTTVQTQPNESLRTQLSLMEPGYNAPLTVEPEQMRLLAYTAIAAGSRGLVFASDTPLDSPDVETRQRAMALELLNLELDVIEPWAAAGSCVATAETNNREVVGTVLLADRARLLLPLWLSPHAQCVPSQSAANGLTLVTPGVPETSDAYELTLIGARPLKHQRVAGGMSVVLDEFGLTAQVLLANDPTIVGAVHRRAAQIGRRAAELQRELAVYRYQNVKALAARMTVRVNVPRAPAWFDAAAKSLQWCDNQLAAGDIANAALNAERAVRSLRLIERAYWDVTVGRLASPVTSPAAVSFDTLPCHWRVVDRFSTGRFGPNQATAGDFEDIGAMVRAGWRYNMQPSATLKTTVELVPQAARTGRLGLRLAIEAADPNKPPAAIETPPIQFVSPQVPVEAGQTVCIYGWVKVPKPITAGDDGLMIVDSLSGEALADRIGQTKGWRQFELHRVAPRSGPMTVTFSLTGLGEAFIDDVAIQVIEGSTLVQR